MINSRELKKVLNNELSQYGFHRKGSTWLLKKKEVIVLVNLQKSNYGEYYYINIGFLLRHIDDIQNPRVEFCHLQGRADGISENDTSLVSSLLDLESSLDDENRINLFSLFIREKIIPLVLSGVTIQGLREIVKNHKEFVVLRDAWEILGVTPN